MNFYSDTYTGVPVSSTKSTCLPQAMNIVNKVDYMQLLTFRKSDLASNESGSIL